MTKLNFDRPYFRYIDNLRRELNRQAAGRLPDAYVAGRGAPEVSASRRCSEPQLSKMEAGLALNLVNALNLYLEAMSSMVNALMPGKKGRFKVAQQRRDEAEAKLLEAARRSVAQMLLAKNEGNSEFLTWYQQLEHRFGECGGEAAWDILNNFAMKKAAETVERLLQE